jgi:hypothetical protein
MMATRAVRDFQVTVDPWPVVDHWAEQQKFRMLSQHEGHRLYKKGGHMAGARMVDVSAAPSGMHLEAWVHSTVPARIMSFFILPEDITIESGGKKGALPRKLGRAEVNDLLAELGSTQLIG